MRSEEDITKLILNVAEEDKRVRTVLLNGSRADATIIKDNFQDFDIVFIVGDIQSFLSDHSWIDVFGDRIILQMPDEMVFGEKSKFAFLYLMLFKDGNRIDLTLFPLEEFQNHFKKDSLTIVLLDKDKLFADIPKPGNTDYLIKRPAQKEFTDCCNEFWWVSTYVAKGLNRNQITYAKEMLEGPVRTMFLKIIEWHIGIKKEFSVSFGKSGKFMKENISPELYDKILSTYPDANEENIWMSLFTMTDIFKNLAAEVSLVLNLQFNSAEEQNVMEYLKGVYQMAKGK